MTAVEIAADDGLLDAFPSENDNDTEPDAATTMILVTSPAGRA